MDVDRVNELIRSQEKDYTELKKLWDNIRKDSAHRKTRKYIEERKHKLDSVYQRAFQNHKLLEEQEILSTHKYMTLNYFETAIKKTYDAAMTHLQQCEEKLEQLKGIIDIDMTDLDEERSTDHSPKIFIQKYRLTQLKKKLTTALTAIQDEKPAWYLQSLTRSLENQWQEINDNHMQLLAEESTLDDEYFTTDHFSQAQENYDTIMENLQEKIYESNLKTNYSNKTQSSKLPRINIPTFTGSYESWNSFYDLFIKIIDDDCTISTTEKMQYLKTHVRGDAEKLIKHLSVNEVNYKAALALLVNRYKDERLIAQKFIDKLLDLPKILSPNAAMLRNMHDTINESLEALKNQKIDITSWDPILIRLVSRKWDQDTNMKYEDQLEEPNKLEQFSKMMKFLEKRFKSLESSKPTSSTQHNFTPSKLKTPELPAIWQDKKGLCWYCQKEHNIQQCLSFKSLNVNERIKKVQDKHMCPICLMHDSKNECRSQKYSKCEICHKAHSTLLHRNYNEFLASKSPLQNDYSKNQNYNIKPESSKNNPQKPQQKHNQIYKASSHVSEINKTQKTILLATALVQATAFDGTPQLLRVLCDQGSEASLCTEEVAQLLGYPRRKIKAEIKGIADREPKKSNYMIDVTLKPRFPSAYKLYTSLIVLPKLTGELPNQDLQIIQNKMLDNIIIADPTYYKRGPIDIILGAEAYSKLLLQGFEKLQDGIIAQNTELGWILSGLSSTENCNGMKIISLITRADEMQFTKYWELEEVSDTDEMKKEDKICEEFYRQTTQRNIDGTYVVRLPFKDATLEYGNSRQKAAARLFQLERKLEKNHDLRQKYNDFMYEYLNMGHMRRVNKDYFEGKYYIPHQAVIREDALTTKLRCVFDASSKSSTNVSLNDNLYKGPRLQQDMSTILLRWRKHKIVFMADIEKMYRFIKIHDDDLPYQRILWRFSEKQPIEEYELTTVTYGTTAAPYLAIKTLQQLAKDEEQNYPIASKIALRDFYVDDILSGQKDIEQAKILQSQLIHLLRAGGFNLRKWSSNSPELLKNIPEENKQDDMLKLPLDETRKSLGVLWSPIEDYFSFKVSVKTCEKPTKRFILSEIAKTFDPLGWLQPITVTMKLLMQELWISKIGWNDIVPDEIKKKWEEIQTQLKCIENIKIPRWCYYNGTKIELHGFGDASEKAYGAVVYCRIKVKDTYHVTLLQAKSKVAPKKHKTTLPRLELCAALLVTKLLDKVIKAIDCEETALYAWTDSMITLGWIRGEADRWQTFVANRVSEIQKTLPKAQWNYVESAENPADIISRGITPSKLQNHEIWWNGPKWLQSEKLKLTRTIPEPEDEIKRCHQTTVEMKTENDIYTRFSSFEKMTRVLTYCLRFIRRQKTTKALSLEDIRNTEKIIILQVQRETFEDEYRMLQKGQNIRKGSKLSSLDPFIDEDGLIRVGGRLQHSQLPYNQKHPVVLPYDHHVTSILTRDAHLKTLHGGNRLMLAYLRQKYWILSGKRKVKNCVNKCVKCIRYKAETAKQKMGSLPKPRVTQSHPFSHTGCDYAGPIQVRAMKGRGHKSYKGYIAVFVCLATKAIHLELVGDLSTESFIAALRRFMARRGHVSHMYSDNATNFVGAANFLNKAILEITQSPQFQNAVTNIGTQWHFNPPAAPHYGGIFEAGVKSMKHHLRRVIGESTLTYEEMTTFLQQIEACLNSRPLCIQSDNINDNIILTPSHFLIGREAVGVPDPISNINTDLLNRWKHIQKMKKDFWNSWTKEYLHQLQQRYKWKTNEENLKIGTVVLIKDDNVSPSRWPLATIKEIHAGKDGATRVVTLERAHGADLKRAIQTLIPLPINSDIETNENNTPIQTNIARVEKRIKTGSSRKQLTGKLSYWFVVLLTLLQVCTTAAATYTIKNLEPGLYIEQMGNATIDRGTFRIETQYKREKLNQDLDQVRKVSKTFKTLCDSVIQVESETHCSQFYHHLIEEEEKFEKTHEYLSEINHTRKKRGLLGQMMTSIFGVNDEVYTDLHSLQQNQQKLIDAANHQTKFMITTVSALNQTEERIQAKLERFRTKLNQALSYVNENNVWYRSIDKNHIKIQVMQSYQLAYNYITEILDYYSGLMAIYLSKATVYSVLTPKNVDNIIKTANSDLPSNINIRQTQLIDTKITENETHIRVLAYFPIAEKAKYTLMHITPIPKKNQDGSFQSLFSKHPIIGVDYNNELYFKLTHEEFASCLHRYNNFICFPVAVINMQLDSNCIVRAITKNENNTECPTQIYNITTNIIWKQLQMANTWLFLTNKIETLSIVCDGQREEVSIHDIGVIQVSENCIIKTKTTILAAKRTTSLTVLASFSKNLDLKLDSIKPLVSHSKEISAEQVLDSSKDIFSHLINKEKSLQTTLDNTIWSSITTQTYLIIQRLRRVMATRRGAVEPCSTPRSERAHALPSSSRPSVAPPPPPPAVYARPAPRKQTPAPQLYELKTFPS